MFASCVLNQKITRGGHASWWWMLWPLLPKQLGSNLKERADNWKLKQIGMKQRQQKTQLRNSCALRGCPFLCAQNLGIRKRRPLLTANHSSLFRRASAPVKYRWSLKRQKWFLGEELRATEWSLRHQQNLGLVALIEIVSYILIESIWHVRKQLNSRASWYKFVYEDVWSHPALEMDDWTTIGCHL